MKKGTKKCMQCGKYAIGHAEFYSGGFDKKDYAVLCSSCSDGYISELGEEE